MCPSHCPGLVIAKIKKAKQSNNPSIHHPPTFAKKTTRSATACRAK